MNKTKIKNFSVWARRYLLDTIAYRMRLLGIDENGIAQEMPGSTDKLKLYNMGTSKPVEVVADDIPKRIKLAANIKNREEKGDYKTAYETIVDEIAYTWFNRLIAIRFMEVNDYLPSGVRVLSSESGKIEPDIVSNAEQVAEDQGFPITKEEIWKYKDSKKLDDLYRVLFFMQCKKLSKVLPALFDSSLDDYTEILLPISFIDADGFICHLVNDIDESDFDLSKQGQVEIIGWLYQYYNSEKKDAVFAAMSNKVKVSKENIPAATQLFTPDWIVRYMVENSLGRLWTDGHPDTSAKSEWKYYLEEAEQTDEVNAQLAEIRESRKSLTPEEIRFIDPCMGSGHILVYAFDVLIQIYMSSGYTERDAAHKIVRNNLWGLDLDKRAYQLAYFSVVMKARQYDRRYLKKIEKGEAPLPNLSHFQDLPKVETAYLDEPIRSFVEQFKDADNYGSLLTVTADDKLDEALDGYVGTLEYNAGHMEHLMRLYKALSQKYDVVCTNPPYMGTSNVNKDLKEFVEKYYSDSKYDLFAAFIEKCFVLSKSNGYFSMITQHSWMFLASFEKLRNKLLFKTTMNMAHLGARAFDEINGEVVQTTAFVNINHYIKNYVSTYKRLVKGMSEAEKKKMFLHNSSNFNAVAENYSKIPCSPVAYWVSKNIFTAFDEGKSFQGITKKGVLTGNNAKFIRFWFEVNILKIGFGLLSHDDMLTSRKKWFPVTSGGEKRKWYGNYESIVNLENDGAEIKQTVENYRLRDPNFYMLEAITWTEVTTSMFSGRFVPNGILFGNGGPVSFFTNGNLKYHLGLLNSNTTMSMLEFLAPTMNYGPEQISRIPLLQTNNGKTIYNIVDDCISISKQDWDSFETSWDFKCHPFIRLMTFPKEEREEDKKHFIIDRNEIEQAFVSWSNECYQRFCKLKENEEELNRIFIAIYGLQDELTPDVADDDITVRKADIQRDVKSFVSYAVGCMFGRYSLDVDGLAYAGGEWDDSKYKTYIPDKDNCIPITDEYFFEDDIVTRFEEFVKVAFGDASLEDNLRFIAENLGIKGNGTAREKIRQYFLKDFFKDHCKTYQKRPIYWLFDTGRKNGFKALCYVHRWNVDTPGNVRIDYMHKLQRLYRNEILRLQESIDNGEDVAKSQKRLEKITTQLKETEEYDAKIGIVVAARTEIDLDDGVKVNYEKVQTGTDGKHYDILAKI